MKHADMQSAGSDGDSRFMQVVKLIAFLLAVAFVITPLPFIIEMPGKTIDVLGLDDDKQIVDVAGKNDASNLANTKLYMVTVSQYGGAEQGVSPFLLLWKLLDTKNVILPVDAVYAPEMTKEQDEEQRKEDMAGSYDAAVVAASKELNLYDAVAKKPTIDIKVRIDDVGGPSAGLIFSLGIIEKAKNISLAGNNDVAGTGTIDSDGNVGKIGGVVQKAFAVADRGVKWFLVPTDNCSALSGRVPDGLAVLPVKTLKEAVNVLERIKTGTTDTLATCS
ncbi:MAG: hypothetical protein LBL41_03785 [Bifidobacteriaceae bacterium]|jgi:PDZ domain-containing protein|nr:hypothetical protein [Bifidobacteriaceae bacterium]